MVCGRGSDNKHEVLALIVQASNQSHLRNTYSREIGERPRAIMPVASHLNSMLNFALSMSRLILCETLLLMLPKALLAVSNLLSVSLSGTFRLVFECAVDGVARVGLMAFHVRNDEACLLPDRRLPGEGSVANIASERLCTNIQNRLHNLSLLFIPNEYSCKAIRCLP